MLNRKFVICLIYLIRCYFSFLTIYITLMLDFWQRFILQVYLFIEFILEQLDLRFKLAYLILVNCLWFVLGNIIFILYSFFCLDFVIISNLSLSLDILGNFLWLYFRCLNYLFGLGVNNLIDFFWLWVISLFNFAIKWRCLILCYLIHFNFCLLSSGI